MIIVISLLSYTNLLIIFPRLQNLSYPIQLNYPIISKIQATIIAHWPNFISIFTIFTKPFIFSYLQIFNQQHIIIPKLFLIIFNLIYIASDYYKFMIDLILCFISFIELYFSIPNSTYFVLLQFLYGYQLPIYIKIYQIFYN